MRKSKISKGLFSILMVVLMLTSIFPISVQAGYSEIIVDETSCETELSEAIWNNVDGDVTGKDGVIVIPDNSSEGTRIITRDMAVINEQMDILFRAKFTLDFTSLPQGQNFIFAMGLQSIEAMSAQRGNIEISFADNGGRTVSVSAYEEDDTPSILLESVSISKGKMKVEVELSSKQEMKFSVNGKQIYSGSIPVSGEGSVGFLQTGSCGAKISNLEMYTYKYDTPENVNFEEDFETGYFNVNVLSSKLWGDSIYPDCSMKIEDYNGSKVLMFRNAAHSYIGTKYAYSNFELTFDVPYMQIEDEYNEAGQLVTPKSKEFGVAYGSDGINHNNVEGYVTATDMICVNDPLGGYTFRDRKDHRTGLTEEVKSKPFSVRLSVIDTQVTFGIKLEGEKEWIDFVSYKLDATPTGQVIIWAPSGASTTFAIDNIKMVNKDAGAKLVDVEYKSSEIPVPEDFVFEPQGLVYNPDIVQTTGNTMNSWYIPVLITAGGCLVALGTTAVVCSIRRKKKKGWCNR